MRVGSITGTAGAVAARERGRRDRERRSQCRDFRRRTGRRTGTDSAGGSAAGTGSIATRGGGSGISSGTATDDRAGFDAHAPANTIPTAHSTRLFIYSLLALNLPF